MEYTVEHVSLLYMIKNFEYSVIYSPVEKITKMLMYNLNNFHERLFRVFDRGS